MLDRLEQKLSSPDPEDRREAAVDLGRAGRPAAALLLRALGDSDWRVRKTAVEALAAVGDDDVISGLVAALSAHDNAGRRNSAIETLIQIGGSAVPALLAVLDTPDPDVRKFAVDILGDIRDTRAVPVLMQALDDPDENLRVSAAEALGKIGDRRAVDKLISCLAPGDRGWLDYAAAEALGAIGDARALGPLLTALGRSSLREPVLEALGRIGSAETAAPLAAGLRDPLRIVREVCTSALVDIFRKSNASERESIIAAVRAASGEREAELLEDMILTASGDQQLAGIRVLGWTGRERSIEMLLALLREEALEEPVAEALMNIGPAAMGHLLRHAGDENALVRRAVAQFLGRVPGPASEEALLKMLGDENGHVRSAAAESVGRLRCARAVAPVRRLLRDEYRSVQESAIRALADIGDETLLDDLMKEYSSSGASMRRNIVQLLGCFSGSRAADALHFAIKDEEAEVRKAAVNALARMPGAAPLRSLLLAITDDDPEVRMLAAEALGRMDAPEAAEALKPLLEDEDLWVRAAAARGLGNTGGAAAGELLAGHLDRATDIYLLELVSITGRLRVPSAFDRLLRLTGHEDPEVRKTAIHAIESFGGEAVRQALIARLLDPHWSVRKAAVEVLGRHPDATTLRLLERLSEYDTDAAVRGAAAAVLGK